MELRADHALRVRQLAWRREAHARGDGVIRLAAVVTLGALVAAAPAHAPAPCRLPAGTVRGIDFTSWRHGQYGTLDAARSLAGLASTGANAIALLATQYQADPAATTVAADPLRTPSDRDLRRAARRAHRLGLRVRLRVMVDVASGQPRTTIAPTDHDAWFASYRRRIRHYARLAQALHVQTLEIGAELSGLTGAADAGHWRRVIAMARRNFDGELSYAANWDDYRQIDWWGRLDEIAIDAYFPLAHGPDPSEDDVVAAWQPYLDDLAALAARFDRRVVFAELGYTSTHGALIAPWKPGEGYSAEEQVTGLAAAFRALAGRRWFGGVYVWDWNADPAAGGPGNTDHTIQGKPAEGTVRTWFAGR
jgi:hypothetical protein